MASSEFLFRQFFDQDTHTYTYLIADAKTREAALIDTVKEQEARDLKQVKELGLKLIWILDTHVHADHVTGAGDIREATGAKTAVGVDSGVECADRFLTDSDEIPLGAFKISALATPGHTSGCMSYLVAGRVFTGDSLMIRGTGRTDFQQGSSELLYDSIQRQLYTLPEDTLVYPAHDYHGLSVSTIGEEKRYNPRIPHDQTLEKFIQIMNDLHLAMPKNIQMALPANLACGKTNP